MLHLLRPLTQSPCRTQGATCMRSQHTATKSSSHSQQLEKSQCSSGDTAPPKTNKNSKKPILLNKTEQTPSTGSFVLSTPHGLGFLECISVASFNMALCPLSPGGSVVKNQPANTEDAASIPESGRSPGVGNGNPLRYSCLENPMDRGDWWATVYGVTESDTTY